jgi:hypothetical protein
VIRHISAIGIAIRNVSTIVIAIRHISAIGIAIRHVSAIVVAIRDVATIVVAIRRVSAIGIAIRNVSAIVIAIRPVSAIDIAILSSGIAIAQVRVAAVGVFKSYERVRLLADLLSHARVRLKIRIEFRVALQKLRVVDQGRRFANLFGNFTMAIEKLIKSRQVPARDVIAWGSLPVWLGQSSLTVLRSRGGRRLRKRGTWEAQPCRHRRTEN